MKRYWKLGQGGLAQAIRWGLPLTILAAASTSCESFDVTAAKSLRDAVRDEHLAYVKADKSLSEKQKQRRARTWAAYDVWLREVGKE